MSFVHMESTSTPMRTIFNYSSRSFRPLTTLFQLSVVLSYVYLLLKIGCLRITWNNWMTQNLNSFFSVLSHPWRRPPSRIGDSDIFPKEKCSNLGVTFDTEMTFNHHISTICSSVRFQLRNMSHIRKYLTRSTTECLVHSLISSRLDFSNGILINLPEYQIKRLQRLQNSAARLITLTRRSSHITPILHSLHWLPVQQRIVFKIWSWFSDVYIT